MTPHKRRDVIAFLGQVATIGAFVLVGYCVEYTGTMPLRTAAGLGAVFGVLIVETFDLLREYRDGERH